VDKLPQYSSAVNPICLSCEQEIVVDEGNRFHIGVCACMADKVFNSLDIEVIDFLLDGYSKTIYFNRIVPWLGSVNWTVAAVSLYLQTFNAELDNIKYSLDKKKFVQLIKKLNITIDFMECRPIKFVKPVDDGVKKVYKPFVVQFQVEEEEAKDCLLKEFGEWS